MSTRKKKYLVAGAVIGGLLLGATLQTGTGFALSNTSSPTDTTLIPTQQPSTTTPDDSTSTQPTGDTTTPDPDSTVAGGSTATQNSDGTVAASSTTTTTPVDSSGDNSQEPDDSTSTLPDTNQPSNDTTQTNNTTVDNTDTGNAQSGNATVEDSTQGGDAATGDAGDLTTLVNAIASSSNLGSDLQTFTYNVNGTQNGNIVINPNDILSTSASGSAPDPESCPTTSTSENDTTIDNNVSLAATSGTATVAGNGVGGNATSGDATTQADIINLIEALISDQRSFLGVININGNLNGNIELPASVIDSLLTPTSASSSSGTSETNNISVNNTISLAATSGTATVAGNGVGGNATSGDATTVLNTCNLINSNIVGGNVLLVFVNVMGTWYGVLLNAPAGTTSTTLGGGISQDTSVPTSQVSATNNETINNIVNLSSISGNALVAGNGIGGNATTGNATAIADVANILGSQIDLSGWLGVLVINVFGTWNGSLTIQPTATTPTQGTSNGHQHHNATNVSDPSVGNGFAYQIVDPPQSFQAGQFTTTAAHILGDSTTDQNITSGASHAASVTNTNAPSSKNLLTDFVLASIGVVLAITGGTTKFFAGRRKKT